jgi:hypothetical protein
MTGPLHPTPIGTIGPILVEWPPMPLLRADPKPFFPPPISVLSPLPLCVTNTPQPHVIAACAAQVKSKDDNKTKKRIAADVVAEYLIGSNDMAMIFVSPDPFDSAFEEELNLCKFDFNTHPTVGLCFFEKDQCIYLASMAPRTPGARIPCWRTSIHGAWLININGTPVLLILDAQAVFQQLSATRAPTCTLLFFHPEITPDISNKGLPIISSSDFSQFTLNQLNNRLNLLRDGLRIQRTRWYDIVESGDVLNYTMRVMKLTQGKLLRQDNWSDWQDSEYLQLAQYNSQGIFGDPVAVEEDNAIFHLVWSYTIKDLDHRKKARCACDGSTHSGSAQVLDKTYANCVNQTISRLFYAIAAAENLLIFGSDVSNAFPKAPPPKQGFYVQPDCAFNEWWVNHKKHPPIPPGHVIPILLAMQGHPESPRLCKKHADAILQDLNLTPTVHKPCLYSGTIAGNRVIFKQQVDDFAIAAPNKRTANILLDMIHNQLKILLKGQGLLDMFNGIDVIQTRDYVKIDCHTYIDKFCEKYLDTWLKKVPLTKTRPTPLPTNATWIKKFNAAVGLSDPNEQSALATKMQIKYKAGVGKLIWAMTTCCPDIAFTSVKLLQLNSAPAKHHYHSLKHAIRYVYITRHGGIYFWSTCP